MMSKCLLSSCAFNEIEDRLHGQMAAEFSFTSKVNVQEVELRWSGKQSAPEDYITVSCGQRKGLNDYLGTF